MITGAASGIGRATAEQLAGQGCSIALVDVDPEPLEKAAAAVEARGVRATRHLVDVADAGRMQALVPEVVAAHGSVQILVNNAGVSVLKSFEDHSLEDLQWLMGVNFWGVVHGCKFFLPELRRSDEAHIVNVSSMFGLLGISGQSSYCASKFAIRGFSESLWAELRDSCVGVTSVHPGGISTGNARTLRVGDERDRARLQERFDRHGHPPEDVARAILLGIERNRLRVIVGREAYLADWLKRLFPVSAQRLFAQRLKLLS